MTYKNKALITAKGAQIMPQFFNPVTGEFEALFGERGSAYQTKKTEQITMHEAAINAGTGVALTPPTNSTLTFEVFGSSSSRLIKFELCGPGGVFVPHTAFNITNPRLRATETTGGTNSLPESWQVYVPGGYTFRARVEQVLGGDVRVKGTVEYG